MKKIIFFIGVFTITLTSFTACNGQETPQKNTSPSKQQIEQQQTEMEVIEMSAKEFKKVVDHGDAQLIDIRTQREYDSGHIPGTDLHMDMRNPNFKDELNKLDKTKPYMVYCHSGGRSRATLRAMKAMGFTKVYHLTRGMLDWRGSNLPLEK